MTKLPVRKKIHSLMVPDSRHDGIWAVENKGKYIKIVSELHFSPMDGINSDKIPRKKAVEYAMICAKVYKRMVEEGLYPPKTNVVVCEDHDSCLSLMVVMPELEVNKYFSLARSEVEKKIIDKKIGKLEKKLGFMLGYDLHYAFNWGREKKTGRLYCHDLHLGHPHYECLLFFAEKLGLRNKS